MKDFKRICQKFNANVLQQLYKKITSNNGGNVNKDVFPISLVQAVFDATNGERLDSILSRFNFIDLEYKGTTENTRASVPILYRRPGLIISYCDYNNYTHIEQYIPDEINDETWIKDESWKPPFSEGSFALTEQQINDIVNAVANSEIINNVINTNIENNVTPLLDNKVDKEEGKGLSTNDFTDEYFDKLNGLPNNEQLTETLFNKVDVVEGKDLSTNDFTNELKSKLESLNNYNDTELRNKIDTLTTNFNTLLNDNPTQAIENFNEIIAFLENIEDSETLEGIIAGIETQIANINTSLNNYATKTELQEAITNVDVSEQLDNYVLKEEGKGLSTNDYDNDAKDTVDLMPEVVEEIRRIVTIQKPDPGYIYLKGDLDNCMTNFYDIGRVETLDSTFGYYRIYPYECITNMDRFFYHKYTNSATFSLIDLSKLNLSKVTSLKYCFSFRTYAVKLGTFNPYKINPENAIYLFGDANYMNIYCNQLFKNWCAENASILGITEKQLNNDNNWHIVY